MTRGICEVAGTQDNAGRGEKGCPTNQQAPCAICGRRELISKAHHFVSVGHVAQFLHAAAFFDWSSKIPYVFLCPNHHALWHELDRRGGAQVSAALSEFENRELERLRELSERREKVQQEIWGELRRAWNKRRSE
jgi:hypothetical protein